MSLRQTMANPVVGGGVAVVIVTIAVFVALAGGEKPRTIRTGYWYYDLAGAELFVDAPGKVAPFDLPSGAGNGVRAHVFSCGSCDGEQFIGYLERHTKEGLEARDNRDKAAALSKSGGAILEVREESGDWMAANSSEGIALMDAARNKCAGKAAKVCHPN